MRAAAVVVLLLFLTASFAAAQEKQERVPVGLRKAFEKRRMATEPPLPPQPRQLDPAQLKRDAAELAQLAQSVPGAIGQIEKGTISANLEQRLKRIEKLSRRLRKELFP